MATYPYTFALAPGEHMRQCPYNKAHQVTNQKYMTHLDKCRQGHKREMAAKNETVPMGVCRFNYLHQYPQIEMESHEQNCQDQYSVVPFLSYHQNEFQEQKAREEANKAEPPSARTTKKNSKSKQPQQPNPQEVEENWDDNVGDYEPGYNPQEKLDANCILYHPMGLSRSERKQFRLENRQRYQRDAMNEYVMNSERETDQRNSERYIPGLNYVVKDEKRSSEWDVATLPSATPRREDDFEDLPNIKREKVEPNSWDTETLVRSSPPRMQDVKDEPFESVDVKPEPICFDWNEDE